MYDSIEDTYCYPGTTVLKNRASIKDQATLNEFETASIALRMDEPLPSGHLDYSHYCAIHRHLFQDVYPWAGKPRDVRISKDGNPFCFPENIQAEAEKLFADLAAKDHLRDQSKAQFAENAAHFLAELNAIHPFREGNGRSQLSFLILLAEHAGYQLYIEQMNPSEMLSAMISSFYGKETALKDLLLKLVK